MFGLAVGIRRPSLAATAVLLCCVIAGCAWKGAGDDGAAVDSDGNWRPRPTQMRVYPSSRFTRSPEEDVVFEAHIEMLDAMGDSTKAVGDYRLELLQADEAGEIGQRLYVWNVPMLTMADQVRHYDSVTRTYRLRLRLDEHAQPPNPTVLRVLFMPVEGQRLEAQQAFP